MLNRSIAVALLALTLGAPPALAQGTADRVLFPTEQQAQQHCPREPVVWLNLPTHVYHYRGQRWYGATKKGAYVCRKDADAMGARPSRNGQ